MIKATITFYGKYGKSFGSERTYTDASHISNYIEYMEKKGYNLDEMYFDCDESYRKYKQQNTNT